MKYITNLSKNEFTKKFKEYKKKIVSFTTLTGKYKNGKMILKLGSGLSMMPLSQSYFIDIKSDNSITIKKMFGFVEIVYILTIIIIILMSFSLLFWYEKNILIISIFFIGLLLFLFFIDFLNKKFVIIKALKNDFECVQCKKKGKGK